MKVKLQVLICVFILAYSAVIAQDAVLCSIQIANVKIESMADIPTIVNNGNDTVILTHQDQNITDIFAQHTIYDFCQVFPNSNPDGELFKYYAIVHGNRTLINELYDYAYLDTYIMEPYPNTDVSTTLIDLLDNKTF